LVLIAQKLLGISMTGRSRNRKFRSIVYKTRYKIRATKEKKDFCRRRFLYNLLNPI